MDYSGRRPVRAERTFGAAPQRGQAAIQLPATMNHARGYSVPDAGTGALEASARPRDGNRRYQPRRPPHCPLQALCKNQTWRHCLPGFQDAAAEIESTGPP